MAFLLIQRSTPNQRRKSNSKRKIQLIIIGLILIGKVRKANLVKIRRAQKDCNNIWF